MLKIIIGLCERARPVLIALGITRHLNSGKPRSQSDGHPNQPRRTRPIFNKNLATPSL